MRRARDFGLIRGPFRFEERYSSLPRPRLFFKAATAALRSRVDGVKALAIALLFT
jgi:hypothetical protein